MNIFSATYNKIKNGDGKSPSTMEKQSVPKPTAVNNPRLPSDISPQLPSNIQPQLQTGIKASLKELSRKTVGKNEGEIINLIKGIIKTQEDRLPFQHLPLDSKLVEPTQGNPDELSSALAELQGLPQIVNMGQGTKTLIVVPTKNKDKIKVGEEFAQMMVKRWYGPDKNVSDHCQVIGRNGDSEAGNQPYTHVGGMKGAYKRIVNAHAQVHQEFIDKPEHSEIDFDNVYDVLFLSFENHIVVREDQSSEDQENVIAYDFPAMILWNDRERNIVSGIGPGVRVPSYYLSIARSCHYEKVIGTEAEDKTKGVLTVGKAIELLSQNRIDGANWHTWVCGKDRYDIILDALLKLYGQLPELYKI